MGLADDVRALSWYHTLELPGGVVTPGFYDLRGVVGRVPLPDSLAGMRCLDAACSDGFWTFEMERRGAAEVVAFDIDDLLLEDVQGIGSDPVREQFRGRARRAFELAGAALGSRAQRLSLSVYDASPQRLGTFDFVFVGSVLLHLQDPVRALRALRSVVRGRLLSCEAIHLLLSMVSPGIPSAQLWHTDDSRWWTPNIAAHRRWLTAAGFSLVDSGGPFFQPFGAGFPRLALSRCRSPRQLYFALFMQRFGAPSHWILAAPGGGGDGRSGLS